MLPDTVLHINFSAVYALLLTVEHIYLNLEALASRYFANTENTNMLVVLQFSLSRHHVFFFSLSPKSTIIAPLLKSVKLSVVCLLYITISSTYLMVRMLLLIFVLLNSTSETIRLLNVNSSTFGILRCQRAKPCDFYCFVDSLPKCRYYNMHILNRQKVLCSYIMVPVFLRHASSKKPNLFLP